MVTVGGFRTANLTNGCDWEARGVAIYDLSSLTWGSVFTFPDTPYTVPEPVVRVIGGT